LLTDNSGKLALEAEPLAKALAFFRSAREAGLLPISTLNYAESGDTWKAFREGRATLAVTSARWYLAETGRAPQAAATLIPAPATGKPLALAQGWCWAIVNARPEKHAEAAALVEWLTTAERLAAWTHAVGVLPPRADSLAHWPAAPQTTLAAALLTHAQLQPPAATLNIVGPPLQQALNAVLNDRATPLSAAALAAQSVNAP
jgi:ABC-type glycerol-3-phosphate transport system substrate-binding protein